MGARSLAHSKTAIAAVLVASGALGWALWVALRFESPVLRCTAGLVLTGSRCCAPGQKSVGGHCQGIPTSCPTEMTEAKGPLPGCVAREKVLSYGGGTLVVAPVDWDSEQTVREVLQVSAFRLDSHEVTSARYARCLDSGACSEKVLLVEPGLPVTGLTASGAERFCTAVGGRLPRPEEWMFAAMGTDGRRYPWGAHGLVCRRAAYGLTAGPCDTEGHTPELAGARSLGKSPEGAHDLAGNVAELTGDPSGQFFAMGGSFRSRFPSQVKAWARSPNSGAPRDDLGFRCAYPNAAR